VKVKGVLFSALLFPSLIIIHLLLKLAYLEW
jgi:hypothetical protein